MKYVPIALILTVLLAACSKEQAPAPSAASAPSAADVAAGKLVAEQKCLSCHGLDGKATGPDIPNLAGQKLAYLQSALNGYKTGSRPHAALQQLSAELSEADARNIAAYYASLKPVAPAVAAPADLGKLAAAACTTCHGADGNSKLNGTPSLAGQHPGFLVNAMHAYQSGARDDKIMATQVGKLDAAGVEKVAMYFATQTPQANAKAAKGDAKAGEPLSGKCGECHGKAGHSADDKTPSLAGQDPVYLVKTMKAYRDGSRPHKEMKAMLAGVKDTDLDHIAAFYAAQAPQAAKFTAPITGKGWADRCDKCHGPQADNTALVAPRIDGQPVAYLVKALKDYREGKRQQSAMHAMGQPLTDQDVQMIADYYSTLAPR